MTSDCSSSFLPQEQDHSLTNQTDPTINEKHKWVKKSNEWAKKATDRLRHLYANRWAAQSASLRNSGYALLYQVSVSSHILEVSFEPCRANSFVRAWETYMRNVESCFFVPFSHSKTMTERNWETCKKPFQLTPSSAWSPTCRGFKPFQGSLQGFGSKMASQNHWCSPQVEVLLLSKHRASTKHRIQSNLTLLEDFTLKAIQFRPWNSQHTTCSNWIFPKWMFIQNESKSSDKMIGIAQVPFRFFSS